MKWGTWIWRGLWISVGFQMFYLSTAYPSPNVDSVLGKGLGLGFALYGLLLNPKTWRFELPFGIHSSIVLLVPLAFTILALIRIHWTAFGSADVTRGIWAMILWLVYLYPLRLYPGQCGRQA